MSITMCAYSCSDRLFHLEDLHHDVSPADHSALCQRQELTADHSALYQRQELRLRLETEHPDLVVWNPIGDGHLPLLNAGN